jgi:predicted Ser/Thr protein kinase
VADVEAHAPECPPAADGSHATTLAEDGRPLSFPESGTDDWGEEGEPSYPPGTMLAGRYRVVSLLKRGGMGEVYRAEDLKLRQQVALKLLPGSLIRDGAALARFHGEVRLARQVSHPNVCRVFDVGEADGRPFLSMEFIDGEDLQSLLRRIGRISYGKALEISRQLIAGLAAIHGCGILHRDLKPGNVMIDGRGRVRIADFGVAALADEPAESSLVGTPAYVAPELWAGGKATVRSDLYALGLVLYEVFTGRRVPPASSTPRKTAARLKEDTRPVPPSALVPEVDHRTEAAILRCLARDPAARPASTLEVVAALPGGDLVADAIAAGETPSPEMVVAAPMAGALRPALASVLLGVVVLGLGGILALSGRFFLIRQVPFESSPEVLAARARSLLRDLGHRGTSVASAYGWLYDKELDRWLKEHWPMDQGAEVRRMLGSGRPALYVFWYRQSPAPWSGPGLAVTPEMPPRSRPGEAYVLLDPQGRLLELEIHPPRESAELGFSTGFPDWTPLLTAAGFTPEDLLRAGPRRTPRVYAESRAAWTGSLPGPGGSSIPIRLEAAAYAGMPVSLALMTPWSSDVPPGPQPASGLYAAIVYFFYISVWMTALYLAYRNLRRGRDDRKGAWRVAAAGFLLSLLVEILSVSALSGPWTAVASRVGAYSLFIGCFLCLCHLGFEPYMRRHWPGRIVSWSRAIAGRFGDPLVGRDVLLGCVFGIADTLFRVFLKLGLDRADVHHRDPFDLAPLLGLQGLLGGLADKVFRGFFDTLTLMIFVLFLRIFVRRNGLAFLGAWAVYASALYLSQGFSPVLAGLLAAGVGAGIDVFVWYRFGVLAGACSLLVSTMTRRFPLTTDLSSWYAGGTLAVVLLVLGLALYGFRTTVSGQPLFQGGVLED